MKKYYLQLALLFICILKFQISFSQTLLKKQTLISLDNIKGVPFYKDRELNDLGIDGFEIDKYGNFYFLGGNKSSCLAVFSNNKLIFHKIYNQVHVTSLYFFENNLYTFLLGNSGINDLIELNPKNGVIIKRYQHLYSKNISSYTFADSSIVIGTLDIDKELFYRYNLNGKYIGPVLNHYNMPPNFLPEKIQQSEWELLGKWDDNFIFWNTNPESTRNEKICMVSKDGKILAVKLLPANFSGDGYVGNPSEDRKVRNGNLYVLGRKGNFALITEIRLKDLFSK